MVNIIEEWAAVEIPTPPQIEEKLEVAPEASALLVLDLQRQNCNSERRPRCVNSLTSVSGLLERARGAGATVVYSLTRNADETDIREEVFPLGNEPLVRSGVDKFQGTDLDAILRDGGIDTVIIIGTSAHGAVLHTGTGAALRDYQVIVPVDCISSDQPYAEQYTVWHLANAPGSRGNVRLTHSAGITFGAGKR
ncbi:MAG: isochorismatase family protein [Theionarchaea archaeon]|nr:isochorismatase family protein [Theionarchaea archaeon]